MDHKLTIEFELFVTQDSKPQHLLDGTLRKRQMGSSMKMKPPRIRKTKRLVKGWGGGQVGGRLLG
jgi:hypothetical protein